MARIAIDLARRIGTVDRRIFSNFIEHLGRCIYGGHLRGGLAAQRRARLPPGRAGRGPPAPRAGAPLAGRQLRERIPLADGVGPVDDRPAAQRARVVRGGVEPLRHERVHRVLPGARHGAVHLREHGLGHDGRGPGLGRVLQRHREYPLGEPPAGARLPRAPPRALLGPRQRDVRQLADRAPEPRGLRQEGAGLRPRHEAHRSRRSSSSAAATTAGATGTRSSSTGSPRSSTGTASTSTRARPITTPPSSSRTRRSGPSASARP